MRCPSRTHEAFPIVNAKSLVVAWIEGNKGAALCQRNPTLLSRASRQRGDWIDDFQKITVLTLQHFWEGTNTASPTCISSLFKWPWASGDSVEGVWQTVPWKTGIISFIKMDPYNLMTCAPQKYPSMTMLWSGMCANTSDKVLLITNRRAILKSFNIMLIIFASRRTRPAVYYLCLF